MDDTVNNLFNELLDHDTSYKQRSLALFVHRQGSQLSPGIVTGSVSQASTQQSRGGSRLSALLGDNEEPRRKWPAGRRSSFKVSCSQLVALSDPIMPILDHLACLLLHRDALQLGQGDPKGPAFPADQD